jgi:hypothetical protein
MLKFYQRNKREKEMSRDYTRTMSEILLVLKNLNDNVRRCEDTLSFISTKLSKMESEKPSATKHIVVLQKEYKKEKGEK